MNEIIRIDFKKADSAYHVVLKILGVDIDAYRAKSFRDASLFRAELYYRLTFGGKE